MPNFQVKPEFKTPKVKIETNTKKERQAAMAGLIKGIQAGGAQVESALPALLDEALESNVWSWPGQTFRQNGSMAGSTRNIVDTGKLKGSGTVKAKFLKTKTVFLIEYKAPYAALVHEGGYVLPYGDSSRERKFIPGRPWISAVLTGQQPGVKYLDVESYMAESVANAWG